MNEMHHVHIVIDDRSEEPKTCDQGGRDTSSFWERHDPSVDWSGMLDPVVVYEEVKPKDYGVLGLDLWAIF